jgi:hypothetical protein
VKTGGVSLRTDERLWMFARDWLRERVQGAAWVDNRSGNKTRGGEKNPWPDSG